MANSAENKSFCELPKYVINTRPHCPKVDEIHGRIAEIDEINETILSTKITVFLNLKR